MKTFHNTIVYIQLLAFLCAGTLFGQTLTTPPVYDASISDGVKAPLRIALAPSGVIYVTDAFNKSISEYDAEGNFIGEIKIDGEPISVAVNSQNELFIGDGKSGDILKYESSGSTSIFFTGTVYPSSMVFCPDDRLYVADLKAGSVLAIDISGNLVNTIGSGIVVQPTGIAFDSNNQRLLVGEHGGTEDPNSGGWMGPDNLVKVWTFNLDGSQAGSIGGPGYNDGEFHRIQGITLGKCGNIYVVDPFLARISIFNENGGFITKFGDWGSQEGQLNIPMDIAFGPNDEIIVSSMNNGKLELFSIEETLPGATIRSGNEMICSGETADIEIEFTGTAPWTFEYTIDGINPISVTTSENPYLLNVSHEGLYEIAALSDAIPLSGTCFTGSAYISVSQAPPTVTMGGDATICEGESTDISLSFTGLPPWTFTYTVDGSNPETISTTNNPHLLSVYEGGLYEITELYRGGCQASDLGTGVEININPLPTVAIAEGNDQIPLGSELTVDLTGTPPWTIIYTIDDLNPQTVSGITSSPYKLPTSNTGTYEIKEVYDALCSNTMSYGYPELIIAPNPKAEDDFAFTVDGLTVIIDVLLNDSGALDPSSIIIIDPPRSGTAINNPDGSISFTPGEGSCIQETFTYTVADYNGFNSNTAIVTIDIEDITPPVLIGVPNDITLFCDEITTPAQVAALDNCDGEVQVTYLGESEDFYCDLANYTISRRWSATDSKGNISSATQIITVETEFIAGCFAVRLISAEYSPEDDQTIFYWELWAENCIKKLKYIAFKIPDGKIVTDPINRRIYQYPENEFIYMVNYHSGKARKGNNSLKFFALSEGIQNGGPEIFVYSLSGEVVMNEVIVEIKSSKDIFQVSVPIADCACSDDQLLKSSNIVMDFSKSEPVELTVYPNPFTEILYFEFQAPFDTFGKLDIYSTTGSKLASLYNNKLTAGQQYKFEYRPGDIAEQLIFYNVIIGDQVYSGKVIFDGDK